MYYSLKCVVLLLNVPSVVCCSQAVFLQDGLKISALPFSGHCEKMSILRNKLRNFILLVERGPTNLKSLFFSWINRLLTCYNNKQLQCQPSFKDLISFLSTLPPFLTEKCVFLHCLGAKSDPKMQVAAFISQPMQPVDTILAS